MHRFADASIAFLALPVSLIVGAPFYVLMARSLERRLSGGPPPHRPGWLRASGFAIWQTIRVTIVASFGWILLLAVMPIPVLNVAVALAVVVAFNGFLVGLLTLAIPLHHRGVRGFKGHLRFAWRHRAYVTGFGSTSMLALAIPFMPLRWLITPVVFVGAVLLHHRIESQHIASSPPLPPSVDDGAPLNVAEIPGHIPAIERAPQAYATERLDWTHHRPE